MPYSIPIGSTKIYYQGKRNKVLVKTGFCWKCGKVIKEPVFIEIGFDGYLFCCKKHQKQYERNIGHYGRGGHTVRDGKKDGYGLAGSTH